MDYRYSIDYEKIAARIKTARKSAGLTQAELAEKINISTNAVAKLENNLMTTSLQTLISIANVLEIDINYLLSDEQEKKEEEDSLDLFLNSLLRSLSPTDKNFMIHVINGLRLYYPHDR